MVWTCEDRLPVRSLEWVPNGRKRGGRPKKTWIQGIMNLMKDRDCRMVTARIENAEFAVKDLPLGRTL